MKASLNKISKSFYINLDRRQDRRDHIESTLPFLCERSPAVDGQSLELNPLVKKIFPNLDKITKAEAACAMSHYMIWKTLLNDESSDNYLILEDDVVFEKGFTTFWNHGQSLLLPKDYSLIYLGGCQPWNKPQYHKCLERYNDCFNRIKKADFFQPDSHYWHMNASSYILSKKGAKVLCDFVDNNGLTLALDHFMIYTINDYESNSLYHLNPLVARQLHEENENTGEDLNSDIRQDTDKFEKTTIPKYMITYEGSKERVDNFNKAKNIINDLTLFPAVDSVNNPQALIDYAIENNIITKDSWLHSDSTKLPGKIGCELSHYKLLNKLMDKGIGYNDWVLILEDDVEICEDFTDHLHIIIKEATSINSDYIRISHRYDLEYDNYEDYSKKQFTPNRKLSKNLYSTIKQYGAAGQLLNGRAIKFILSLYPLEVAIDNAIGAAMAVLNGTTYIKDIAKNIGSGCQGDNKSLMGSIAFGYKPRSENRKINVIWQGIGGKTKRPWDDPDQNFIIETDWLLYLLGDIKLNHINDDSHSVAQDNSIVIYSDACPTTNKDNNLKIKNYFDKFKDFKNCYLIHLSDEHCLAETSHYKYFKHVFRNIYRDDIADKNVTFFPLGYKSKEIKKTQEQLIPKKIHQTWETKNITPGIQSYIDKLKNLNPDFDYELYDKDDRETFLKEHFDGKVFEAYSRIVPGAMKADLWRYCLLYKYGGIFSDIDLDYISPLSEVINGFSFVCPIDLDNDFNSPHQALNGFLCSSPGHPILKNCIDLVVSNVIDGDWDPLEHHCLDLSGPGALGMSVNFFMGREKRSPLNPMLGEHEISDYKIKLVKTINDTVKDIDETSILSCNKEPGTDLEKAYNELSKQDNVIAWSKNNFSAREMVEPSKEIPKVIVQTGLAQEADQDIMNKVLLHNKDYKYVYYNDDDCIKFLDKHFTKEVVNAFHAFKPGAYKADLFRYCYLYIKGGVYLDLDMSPLISLDKIIDKDANFISCQERWGIVGIFQGFMACTPGISFLKTAIEMIVRNTQEKYYPGNKPGEHYYSKYLAVSACTLLHKATGLDGLPQKGYTDFEDIKMYLYKFDSYVYNEDEYIIIDNWLPYERQSVTYQEMFDNKDIYN